MTPPSQPQTRCLIIGGGLGGLALAQSLRKQNISFEVFERDTADGSRAQGWAITLHDWFLDDLYAAIEDDMPDLEPVGNTYELGLPCEGAIYDAATMHLRTRIGGAEDPKFIRANRAKLRHWLLTHLNVHWGKQFVSYTQDADGVTAHFADGTSARGDILVGADGVSSHVRAELLPGPAFAPQNVAMGAVLGELTATEEQYTRWMKLATSFFSGTVTNRRIFVALAHLNPDGTAAYYWMFGWATEEARKDDFWTTTASKQELHDFVMNNLEGVHPSITEVLRATPVEGMLHPPLRFRDLVPPELPHGRVTLLGDAVHAMVPFRGEGANIAMKDSFRLASFLASAGDRPVEAVLKEYEADMRPRATESVLMSREQRDPGKPQEHD